MSEVNYLIQKPKKYEIDMDDLQRNIGTRWRKRARRLIERRWDAVNKKAQGQRYATR